MNPELRHYLADRRAAVEEALDQYSACPGSPPRLVEAMRYSLLAGGKRLRPILVIAAAEMFGLSAADVMPTACALEMIHTYSLIHDDLPCMDDDDLRRGRPTSHKVFGEAMAVLAGDALLTRAFAVMAEQGRVERVGPARALRAIAELAEAAGAAGMVGGQVEDLEWEGRQAGEEQLERIHSLKTGALFRAAVRLGGVLAGAAEADVARLDDFAAHFGLAFQIWDDVLDVAGDAALTGKGVGRDARQQKSTYVTLHGLEGAQERARAAVQRALEAIAPFGANGWVLQGLAKYVVDRAT
ncbi:polyprenyl synthetase family protein [Symbiobacterium terraclitae]|uniref:polyprenyl synthetase family protein n=1 Tax=Symbiobacterium terraclitae TaxID=557451 RepID=UPI0035B5674D